MSRFTEVFATDLINLTEEEISFIESYVFQGKTTNEWVLEADNHPEPISDDPIYWGEPVSQSLMQMARTSMILAQEAYKNL